LRCGSGISWLGRLEIAPTLTKVSGDRVVASAIEQSCAAVRRFDEELGGAVATRGFF